MRSYIDLSPPMNSTLYIFHRVLHSSWRTLLVLLACSALIGHTHAQGFSFETIVQGGATNVNGLSASTLGGRGGLRLGYGGQRLRGAMDICFAYWRDNVWQTNDSVASRFVNKFNLIELAPGAEYAISPRVRVGAGGYIGHLLNSKERIRAYNRAGTLLAEQTRATTGLFHAVDVGLRFRVGYEAYPGWWLEAVFSQGLRNASVLGDFGIRAVPQGLLLGLAWSPRHAR